MTRWLRPFHTKNSVAPFRTKSSADDDKEEPVEQALVDVPHEHELRILPTLPRDVAQPGQD